MIEPIKKYHQLLEEIDFLAKKNNRKPEEVKLLPVTKNVPLPMIQQLYEHGCHQFGESYVQELLSKQQQTPSDTQWHFIGNLQRNKVAKILGKCSLIHSVNSMELAEKISQTPINTQILLEINTSGEASKHGFTIYECQKHFENLLELPNIKILGLMTMAPFTQDEYVIRKCFSDLRELREDLKKIKFLPELSMGMSNDYHYAIAEGATLLRIGSAIFSDEGN